MADMDLDVAEPSGGGGGGGGGRKKALTIEKMYQKKSQLEHILLRPDTYIGSVEKVTEQMWVYDSDQKMMVMRDITYVPGLYKIFDEILVNAADNKQKDPSMDCIKITIDPESNVISVWNNGQGIPVVEHADEKMYVPTMIFGHLLTSSNYNDEEEKVTGGRNGYGAKLCNIFSTKFSVETSSKEYKRAFKQTWTDNMGNASQVKLKDSSGEDYTKITFSPDLSKFHMESLDKDIVDLMSRRAFDVAASTRGVKVFLNGTRLPVKTFKDYIDLYIKGKNDEMGNPLKVVYEKAGERWEVALTLSEKGFQQVSFVNSIATTKGGRHVDYVVDMISKNVVDIVNKKNKGGITIKPFQIKNHMWLFVNCLIVNPSFDSQTKEHMTLQVKSFGSKCTLSEKFMTNVSKCGLIEQILSWAKFKAQTMLEKTTGKKKTSKLKGVPKLEDANDAGTKNSLQCTLILTEGDSAKALAVSGLGVIGRDKYGVFPLRGKLLNVREASHKQILENAEINNIIKIMGLQYHKKYETKDDMASLRYGKIMIMTDQDQDGSHIKGLIVNFIHYYWPSLIKMPFLEVFITPLVKAFKGNDEFSFFSLPEFEEWKVSKPNWKTYRVKYYKGLGTSTSKEAKEYFSNMERHRIKFKYTGNECDNHIVMAFSKKHVEQRKEWLTNWMRERKRRKELGLAEEYLYTKETRYITFTDFINKELILFSNMDNERSIPSMVDGLKPGQRKVLYTCFKRNDKREIKVAQLAGSVAEHSAYHHGEASLMSTIINLAQNYVGSNNINLLQPIGQFGTRLQGGKDSASPRYIFTKLSPLARLIFPLSDDPILKKQFEDNQKIEPVYYVPIIPMVLVNGADGIGTGWMTKIPNFNPRELARIIRGMIGGQTPPNSMKPWYKNFKGDIDFLVEGKYVCSGEVGILSDEKLEITELPVGVWTQNYKETVLEVLLNGNEKSDKNKSPLITNYREYNTDTTIRFVVQLTRENLKKCEDEGLHQIFKLQSTMNLTSMVVFDRDNCLRKFDQVGEMLKEYYEVRLDCYQRRKDYLVGMLEAEAVKLSNQARFILEKCSNKISVENKKRKAMIDELKQKGYASDPVKAWKQGQQSLEEQMAEAGQEDVQDEGEAASPSAAVAEPESGPDYDYLLGMSLWALTLERKEELINKKDEKLAELDALKMKTPGDLWNNDLDAFLEKLEEVEEKEKLEAIGGTKKGKAVKQQEEGKGRKRPAAVQASEAAPSPHAIRVAPSIAAEMKRKAEVAIKTKERKANKQHAKDGDDEMDEFDRLEADGKKTLAEKLGNSPSLIEKKFKAKKAARAPRVMDSSPKKKGKKKKKDEFDSTEDEASGSDSDAEFRTSFNANDIPAEPTRKTSRTAALNRNFKFNFDSDPESDGFSSDSEKVPAKKPAAKKAVPAPPAPAPAARVSDSDSDSPVKNGGDDEPVDNDKLFDSLLSGKSESDVIDPTPPKDPPTKGKGKAKKEPAAKKAPAKKRAKKDSDFDSDDSSKKTKKKPRKKQNDSDSEDFAPKPKAKGKKGKKKTSDSEDEVMDLDDLDTPVKKPSSGRARKTITYAMDSDDDSD